MIDFWMKHSGPSYGIYTLCHHLAKITPLSVKVIGPCRTMSPGQALKKAQIQFALAQCYSLGLGVHKNPAQEVLWIKASANKNYDVALYKLSLFYFKEFVVKKDLFKAFTLCHRAAIQDLANAQCTLSSFYKKGDGIKQNIHKAIHWMQKAANQEFPDAMNTLGVFIFTGRRR